MADNQMGEFVADYASKSHLDRALFFFTDAMAQDFVNGYPAKYAACGTDEEKASVKEELRALLGTYSLLVYMDYVYSEEFKKGIDSSPELFGNFCRVKDWMDANRGEDAANAIIGNVVENRRGILKELQEAASKWQEMLGTDMRKG